MNDSKEIAIPEGYGTFTNEQIAAGQLDTGGGGYLSNFKYTVRLRNTGGKLAVYKGEELVGEYDNLAIILYYAHQVWRLRKGTTTGLTGDRSLWPDEMRGLVAQTYENPFSRREGCRGNFDPEYSDYLDLKEARKGVEKRIFVFMSIPDIMPAGEVAVASFGFTAHDSLTALSNKFEGLNMPLSAAHVNLGTTTATNDNNQGYPVPQFTIMDTDGKLSMTALTVADHEENLAPITAKIRKIHGMAVRDSQTASAPQLAAPAPQELIGSSVDVSAEYQADDIPF